MNKEIGNVEGVRIMVNPETYEDIKKQKTIYENKILKELQQRIDKAIEYIEKENNEKFYNPTIVFALDRRKEKLLSILKGSEE